MPKTLEIETSKASRLAGMGEMVPHQLSADYLDKLLRPVSITAARCVAWRAIVSDSYRFNALRSASTRSGNGNGHH